ncbi:hypothetical protein Q7M76_04235 [Candidatus Liberibacter asiaticus]|uniref:Uncharacterized protein n=3 Tax=Liberibacter asiaticus TaxID=34021 RepID=C6XGD5_LIBAP|nr:hypothetical protein [Candidatus Liberibacter asiaticus]ACT57438.1 hypothetical protein CLIBASIA_04330 [Candidatus Liberibacter asiaticus str. psy62]AGH17202.1 hypothetical protein WSI_04160 [Candidatus Liberibacter asiaticus str. gxpsy]ALK07502.1 hypothetical protein CD16_04235 [Candidatus Liberibacter asiaticus]ASK52992.1 hypothetical protein B2I23_04300 [Candidatus Liberibacter asiaticus]KAE9509849.1 hypothetical protein FXW22_04320 [Candidatus Liberibacter asiaticus]
MKYKIAIIILLVLVGVILAFYFQQSSTPQNHLLFFSEKAVWKGDSETYFQCKRAHEFDENFDNCIITSIKKTGGTQEALRAAQYLEKYLEPGYVSSYRKEALIGIVEVQYPYRANENSGTLLIPTVGSHIIDINDSSVHQLYDSSPIAKDFVLRNPGVFPYSAGHFVKSSHKDGLIELIFSYPLRSCHGCEDIGFMDIAYKFTTKGAFIGRKVFGIRNDNAKYPMHFFI